MRGFLFGVAAGAMLALWLFVPKTDKGTRLKNQGRTPAEDAGL